MPALIERPKMTRTMYQSLKRHIMRERDKIKQAEQDQEAAEERVRKEREMRKKKEQEDSLTLEQTKDQVSELEKKLESLRTEKHELFSSLKKVLHHEDETKRRTQLKEHNELLQMGQHYAQQIPVSHPVFLHGAAHAAGRPSLYKPPQSHHMMQGIKRPRSPSPQPSHHPPVSVYGQHYQDGSKYPQSSGYSQSKVQQGPYGPQQKHTTFQPQTSHVYSSQSGHTPYQQHAASYTTSQQSTSAKYPASQSAFSSYPSHYAHQQKQLTDHYPTGYPIQRIQQGYLSSQHTSAMQQQLDHGQKTASVYAEEKYKMQQAAMRSITGVPPQQVAMLPQVQLQQQAQNKGSIVSGYPVRTQPQSTPVTYPTTQGSYNASQQNNSPHPAQRHTYHSTPTQQPPVRYY
ncbi:uncharacterized protein LOC141906967 [Tubulanus polymorphus]|uniref:uncharacterized protein LOC141906967 n=1 Tax=Tubulanus polymorphus TaxID=672921 RepID=UPI003DA62F9D